MTKSRFVFDKFAKLIEQGLVNYKDISDELISILKSKRDEIIFKMKLASKEEVDILNKRIKDVSVRNNLKTALRGEFLDDAIRSSQKSNVQYGQELDATKLDNFFAKKSMMMKELFEPEQLKNIEKLKKLDLVSVYGDKVKIYQDLINWRKIIVANNVSMDTMKDKYRIFI